MGRNGDGAGDFARSQHLEERGVGAEYALGLELSEAKGRTFERFDVTEVNHGVINTVHVIETTLRQTTVKRHLAAFETGAVTATRTGLHTLVTTTGSLTVTRTATAAEDLVTVSGALNGGQRMELQSWEVRLSAERLDLFERAELGETIKRRLHDGLRVIRTHRL